MLTGRTFLITGATGRLGCDLTERLEQLNAGVLPLVLPGYPPLPKRLLWKADTTPIIVRTASDLEDLPDPDYVIHLHWTEDRSLPIAEQRDYAIEGNVERISFFWDWLLARTFRRLVNISTIKMFANNSERPVTSQTEPRPSTPYGYAKAFVERFLESTFDGRPLTHLRLSSIASGGENETQLLTRLYLSAFRHQEIVVSARQTYLMYIDDAVDFMIQTACRGSDGKYNLVAPGHPNEWIALKFEEISGRRLNAVYGKRTSGGMEPMFGTDVPELISDWIRVTPIEEIIRKIIEYYCAPVETRFVGEHR